MYDRRGSGGWGVKGAPDCPCEHRAVSWRGLARLAGRRGGADLLAMRREAGAVQEAQGLSGKTKGQQRTPDTVGLRVRRKDFQGREGRPASLLPDSLGSESSWET